MNFEGMSEKYPHLKPMLDQMNELARKDEFADEKAAELQAKAKEEREEAEKRAQEMEKQADEWLDSKNERDHSRTLLKSSMMIMCTALAEKDAEIEELKNDFKSTLEQALPQIADDDTEKLVTDHIQRLEPETEEEEAEEIPELSEVV